MLSDSMMEAKHCKCNKMHSENADTSTSLIIVYTKMAQKDIIKFFDLIHCTIVIIHW